MPNTTKIPCGGFYLGDGLTMEGDTLKSLGGVTLVEVIQTGESEYGYADFSPIKNYKELERSINLGLVFCRDIAKEVYTLTGFDSGYVFSIPMELLGQNGYYVKLKKFVFHPDNTITFEVN